jgi:hypothetical protein
MISLRQPGKTARERRWFLTSVGSASFPHIMFLPTFPRARGGYEGNSLNLLNWLKRFDGNKGLG